MDLIYMNQDREDLGVLKDYSLDLAFGIDENDFECKIPTGNHCCGASYFLYIEGTEYGGIIDGVKVDSKNEEVTYLGRTWHGILESKILEPDAGADYLVLSGEGNEVLSFLMNRMGLHGLFKVSTDDSGISVNYKMHRYVAGFTGIRKMLQASDAKLHIAFTEGMVELSAVPLVDYTQDEQFDTDQMDFVIQKNFHPVNHVICLGKGELADREVIHVYADEKGNISEKQIFFGLDEITAVYDYSMAESTEELKQGGIDLIKESWNGNTVSFDFDAEAFVYDIGDIVGAREILSGTEVAADITKKIVNIKSEIITIQYEVGE